MSDRFPSARAAADTRFLVVARVVRLFAYGCLSVVLAIYLSELHFSSRAIGALFTGTLLGDAVVSLWLTTSADRFGRRRTLVAGAGLMAVSGAVFALTTSWVWLLITAIAGVISPTGNEIGPFLSIEQAALAEILPAARRTSVFARYQVAASFAGAAGALAGGLGATLLERRGVAPIDAHRWLFALYGAAGIVLVLLFLNLSAAVEPPAPGEDFAHRFGLHRSQRVVVRLSALFAIDSFGGGFVLQTLIAYWFHLKFGADEATLGGILFVANLVAGVTALSAARIAARIGLVRTMVVTHLPSNVLLALVPFMPTLPLAIVMLVLRFSISQMDVPTRQSYIVAVVDPSERSAAAGVTTIARSLGASLSPVLSGWLLSVWLAGPFVAAGGLKILYDVLLFRGFHALKPPEEE